VSDDIKNSFKSVRNGNYPVRTSGHVLVLNWNDKVRPAWDRRRGKGACSQLL
jgi:hypothetical protein